MNTQYQAKVGPSSTSPIRVIFDVNAALTATGSVTVTLGGSYSLPPNSFPLCTIRDANNFGAPYLTRCAYDAGANTYTLQLIDPIPTGRYLLEVTSLHLNVLASGTIFPANTQRTSLRTQVFSAGATLVGTDLDYLAPAARKLLLFILSLISITS